MALSYVFWWKGWGGKAVLGDLVHEKAGFGAREGGFGGLVHEKGGFGAREVVLGALVHEKAGFGAREVVLGALVHEKAGFGARDVSESWIRQSTAYSTDNEGYHFCWYNTSCIGADAHIPYLFEHLSNLWPDSSYW